MTHTPKELDFSKLSQKSPSSRRNASDICPLLARELPNEA